MRVMLRISWSWNKPLLWVYARKPDAGIAGQPQMRGAERSYRLASNKSARVHFLMGEDLGDDQRPGQNGRRYAHANIPLLARRKRDFAPARSTTVAEPPTVPDDPECGRRKNRGKIAQAVAHRVRMNQRRTTGSRNGRDA